MSSAKRLFLICLVVGSVVLYCCHVILYKSLVNHNKRRPTRVDSIGSPEPNFTTFHETRSRPKSMTSTFHSPSVTKNMTGIRNVTIGRTADSCDACFKNDFRFIVNADVCEDYDKVDLLVLIFTRPKDFQERQVIRETWGSLCTKAHQIACVFLLGFTADAQVMMEIKAESWTQADIVQLDFTESYGNLTFKTMSGFRWSRDFCSKARFIMKADGDMYVNLELIPILLQAVPQGKFYGGFCWGEQTPHRSNSSKWYVSFKSYSHKKFPPVCSGTAYLISSDFLRGLMNVSRNIPFFHLEDVFIGMAASALKVRPTSIKGFTNLHAFFTPCSYRNEVLTSHYVKSGILKKYWIKSQKCPLAKHSPAVLYNSKKV